MDAIRFVIAELHYSPRIEAMLDSGSCGERHATREVVVELGVEFARLRMNHGRLR
jgi:hypothetical protein